MGKNAYCVAHSVIRTSSLWPNGWFTATAAAPFLKRIHICQWNAFLLLILTLKTVPRDPSDFIKVLPLFTVKDHWNDLEINKWANWPRMNLKWTSMWVKSAFYSPLRDLFLSGLLTKLREENNRLFIKLRLLWRGVSFDESEEFGWWIGLFWRGIRLVWFSAFFSICMVNRNSAFAFSKAIFGPFQIHLRSYFVHLGQLASIEKVLTYFNAPWWIGLFLWEVRLVWFSAFFIWRQGGSGVTGLFCVVGAEKQLSFVFGGMSSFWRRVKDHHWLQLMLLYIVSLERLWLPRESVIYFGYRMHSRFFQVIHPDCTHRSIVP